MKIEDVRKQVLLWSMIHRSEEVTDRLLNAGIESPVATGDFYITVNGIPLCVAELALVGQSNQISACEYATWHQCIRYRNQLKAAFPGAIVAVIAGFCPEDCSFSRSSSIKQQEFQAAPFDDWSSLIQL